ncbi:MAG TPA: alpha-hydroxy-acid oxidizing protein, partial [Balneolaceae bacterium]|nr:alpha-hydroxy-acid oxidizing protein [Balneolaceae bacterium]
KVIDVAGAGGTSWAKVENERTSNTGPDHSFDDWGLPTADCIRQVSALRKDFNFELIASGGIRSSHDIAKSFCLGAHFAAAAQPVIKAVVADGFNGLEQLFKKWQNQLITILTLLGCERPDNLEPEHLKLRRMRR